MRLHTLILCTTLRLVLTTLVFDGLNYTLVSPDGLKDVWCPEFCLNGLSDIESKQCCACDGVPDYEMKKNKGQSVNVIMEILNVKRSIYKIMEPQSSLTHSPTYQFIYTGRSLRGFPLNLCELSLVKIDVSDNLFTEIGNISCLKELDTLIMAYNQITILTNETFVNLTNLRYVDLSYNMIRNMGYNVYQQSDLFTLIMDGNYLNELDIGNMYKTFKTTCLSSYANNKYNIETTNLANFQTGPQVNAICNDVNLSNVSFTVHPLILLSKDIYFRTITKYVPCGETRMYGSPFDCDCTLGEFFQLLYLDVVRFMKKDDKDYYCSKPDELENIRLFEVYNNQTMRDLMTCDVVDYCPRNGNCKCTCTSMPNRNVLIVDCSNQSCTDFPEVVPETMHDIILNMSYNKIENIHSNRTYFEQVTILDMRGNAIKRIEEDIPSLTKVSDIIITDHRLTDLPKSIQLVDPNIFHFGKNGIHCTCDNRWIGEWRSFKKASKAFPYALYCSNFNGKLFEDEMGDLMTCESDETSSKIVIGVSMFLSISFLTLILSYCCRYEILIARRLFKSRVMKMKIWEIDVYISFEEDNEEIRSYILVNLEQFFRKKKMTTYIQCRDAWVGYPEEDNVRNNMIKCKYALIVQTKGMYTTRGRHEIRRFEYRLAWDLMMEGKLSKVFVLQFDRGMEKFMARKTRALIRFGLTFNICDRKRSLYGELMKAFDEPITVNSKHKFRRGIQTKANLLKKDKS